MRYRQWPYNVRCFFAAPVPRWLTGTLLPVAIAALVAAVFCPGCAEFKAAMGTVKEVKAQAVREAGAAYDAQMVDSQHWLCDWSSAAATRRFWAHYPQEVHDGLCGKGWLKVCEPSEE